MYGHHPLKIHHLLKAHHPTSGCWSVDNQFGVGRVPVGAVAMKVCTCINQVQCNISLVGPLEVVGGTQSLDFLIEYTYSYFLPCPLHLGSEFVNKESSGVVWPGE